MKKANRIIGFITIITSAFFVYFNYKVEKGRPYNKDVKVSEWIWNYVAYVAVPTIISIWAISKPSKLSLIFSIIALIFMAISLMFYVGFSGYTS